MIIINVMVIIIERIEEPIITTEQGQIISRIHIGVKHGHEK